MASNLLSDFNDDTPSLVPQSNDNLIDMSSPEPPFIDSKSSSEDQLISTKSDDSFDPMSGQHSMADNKMKTSYEDQFADLLGDLGNNVTHDAMINSNSIDDRDHLMTTSSDSEAHQSGDSGVFPRLEDTLADYQPPKRYSKKEKDHSAGPNVYITCGGLPVLGGAGCDSMCKRCNKRVYEMEKMIADKDIYHKMCFRCLHCNRILSFGNFAAINGQPYCKPHFIELFKKRGQYDTITKEPRPEDTDKRECQDDTDANGEAGMKTGSYEDEQISEQTHKEEPIHFDQMSSVRNMFESASKSSAPPDFKQPSPSKQPSKWDKPHASTAPRPAEVQAEDVKVADVQPTDTQTEEDELPPPAITRSLVARFQGIQHEQTSASDRKPIHKITPPRDELATGIEQAKQQQEGEEQTEKQQPHEEEIVKCGSEPYPASELPPPKHLQNMIAKFKSMEDLTPPSPEKTSPSSASLSSSDNQHSTPAGMTHSLSNHVGQDRVPDQSCEEPAEEESELPNEGFTKSLLAKWRSLEEATSKRDRSRQQTRQMPKRAHSLPSTTVCRHHIETKTIANARTDDDIARESDIIRESDTNEDQLPPPCYTKNIVAKFLSLEADAKKQASQNTVGGKKNFKWSVKESALISPSGMLWQEKRRYSETDQQPIGHGSDNDAHDVDDEMEDDHQDLYGADQPANEELPPPSVTKNLVAKFRSLEATEQTSP